MQRSVAAALIVTFALSVGGCGGGGGDAKSSSSAGGFVTQVNNVCEQLRTRFYAAAKKSGHGSQEQRRAALTTAVKPTAGDLDAIEPPAKLGATYDQFKAAFNGEIEATIASMTHDTGAAKNAQEQTAKASALARKLGVTGC